MKLRWLFFAISLIVLVPGILSLVINGLKPAIDFIGGSLLEVRWNQTPTKEVTSASIQENLSALYEVGSVQSSGNQQFLIRGRTINNDVKELGLDVLQTEYGSVEELRFETVGPTLGRELILKTLLAAGLAGLLISIYVTRQFSEVKYGIAAIVAMLHDSLVLLGIFSLLGWWRGVEVDILFVTALLTTLSFSVHDTIVVFDRIREFKKLQPKLSFETIINGAILQTLGRSLNNSLTIIIMLIALVVLGGESIRWFAVALLVGAITGTYSSTFTAAPLVLTWDEVLTRWRKRTQR